MHIIMYVHMHAGPHHCVRRGLRGPVGVGWCACDKTNIINHVHAHLVGLGGGSVHYAQCYWTWGVGSMATT